MGHLHRHHGRRHCRHLDRRRHLEATLPAQEGGPVLARQEPRAPHRIRSEPVRRPHGQGDAHTLRLRACRPAGHVYGCGYECECVWGEAQEEVFWTIMKRKEARDLKEKIRGRERERERGGRGNELRDLGIGQPSRRGMFFIYRAGRAGLTWGLTYPRLMTTTTTSGNKKGMERKGGGYKHGNMWRFLFIFTNCFLKLGKASHKASWDGS